MNRFLIWALLFLGTIGVGLGQNVNISPPPYPNITVPQGRLTLTTATPVLTATVSAATTIYYTPYVGNLVPIYDGTNFTPTPCAELTNATAQSSTGSAGPAVVANTSVYDLFVWNNAGACTLTRGPLWTNDTTRAAGTALVRTNGVWLNNATITNGPAASRGTYVGTVRSNGTATIDYIYGASASGGTAAFFGVWNAYNRVITPTVVTDSTVSWAYTSATVRAADNSNGNRVSFVLGLAEDGVNVEYMTRMNVTGVAATLVSGSIGVALDATNALDKAASILNTQGATVLTNQVNTEMVKNIYTGLLGFHFVQATESGDTNSVTFIGGAGAGLFATVRN